MCDTIKSKFLQDLPQYHFDRDDFTNVFYEVFGSTDEIFNLIVAVKSINAYLNFTCFMTVTNFTLST